MRTELGFSPVEHGSTWRSGASCPCPQLVPSLTTSASSCYPQRGTQNRLTCARASTLAWVVSEQSLLSSVGSLAGLRTVLMVGWPPKWKNAGALLGAETCLSLPLIPRQVSRSTGSSLIYAGFPGPPILLWTLDSLPRRPALTLFLLAFSSYTVAVSSVPLNIFMEVPSLIASFTR